jgi:CHASE2 domain-containing sensor protein
MKKFSFTGFFKKHYVFKEALLATGFTILITYLVSFIPFKFEFSKAIRQEFLGFDIYDLHFTKKHLTNTKRDTAIILIEIAEQRDSIASQVNIIQKYSPAIVGIDAVFEDEEDTLQDKKLREAVTRKDNVVFGSGFKENDDPRKAVITHSFFETSDHGHSGHINLAADEVSVVRDYHPFYTIGDSLYPSFTSAIIKKVLPGKYDTFKRAHKGFEIINYTGNIETYTSISKEQLLEFDSTGQLEFVLAGKIVLLGYFDKRQPPEVMRDLHFSPLNERVAGKSFPDMYGVVIHANIISMILSGKYATQAPYWLSYLLASAIVFLFLYYMLSRYKKKQHPKHGIFLLIQFLLIILMLYIFLMVFNLFLVKIPLLPVMISLVLCMELLGAYKSIALWLHRRYRYQTVFIHKLAI